MYLAQRMSLLGVNVISLDLEKYQDLQNKENLEEMNTELFDKHVSIDFKSLTRVQENTNSTEEEVVKIKIYTKRCVIFSTNNGIYAFDKSQTKIYKMFGFEKDLDIKLSSSCKISSVQNQNNVYLLKIEDSGHTHHFLAQLDLQNLSVIKSRLLKGVSHCVFYGKDETISDSEKLLNSTPMIAYLDKSMRLLKVEKAFKDLELREYHLEWFKKDLEEFKSAQQHDQDAETKPEEKFDFSFDLQVKQTVQSLLNTSLLGSTLILVKNVFNNLILT